MKYIKPIFIVQYILYTVSTQQQQYSDIIFFPVVTPCMLLSYSIIIYYVMLCCEECPAIAGHSSQHNITQHGMLPQYPTGTAKLM